MERAQAEIAGAASEFDQAVGALPDSSWPVSTQLDAAVRTIKTNVKTILDAKAEAAHYKTVRRTAGVQGAQYLRSGGGKKQLDAA